MEKNEPPIRLARMNMESIVIRIQLIEWILASDTYAFQFTWHS